MNWRRSKFTIVAISLQVLFIILFGLLADYDSPKMPTYGNTTTTVPLPGPDPEADLYPLFQDVHVMIFIGFGFLMTFLKRYGYGAVSINLLVAAFVIQWAFLVRGFIHFLAHGHGKFIVNISGMLSADFAAATVLISFGAVLGKTSPLQLLVMALAEVVFSQVNEWIGLDKLGAVDVGESMFIHAFGAYFGLAVARVLHDDQYCEAGSEGTVYHSDIFSMVGTVFLWIFWPSFNGAGTTGDDRQRAIINTYLSLAACTLVVFAVSQAVDKKGRFNMVHMQNATLAGGVAVGTSADLALKPWGALTVGSLAGLISVIGFQFITPFMASRLKIHDTCGVHNLHGMPGVLAGIVGAIMAALTSDLAWDDRTSGGQAGYQIIALVVTLVFALVSGALTGLLLRLPCLDNVKGNDMYDDQLFFIVEDQGFPGIDNVGLQGDPDVNTELIEGTNKK